MSDWELRLDSSPASSPLSELVAELTAGRLAEVGAGLEIELVGLVVDLGVCS